ncbi:MAG: hypothetical protein M0R74_05625, partial [Dehalococcoidia bacterium]|nr:hypothetical protein [Dehalococcoidia bacterium]
PQGDFARFLHDKPRDRQDLLVRLLDVEIYREMARAANQRAALAGHQAESCRSRLENEFAHATEENLALLRSRVASVEELVASIDADVPRLEALAGARAAAAQRAEAAHQAHKLLQAVHTPEGIDRLAADAAGAGTAARAADAAVLAAAERVQQTTEVLQQLPAQAELEALRRDYQELARTEADQSRAVEATTRAIEAERRAEAAVEAAQREADAAAERREAVLRDNYAFRVAQGLRKGDLCPICGELLSDDPQLEPPPGHEEATAERAAADKRLEAARHEFARAQADAARRAAEADAYTRQAAELRARLTGQPQLAEVADLLAKVAAAEQEARAARSQQAEAMRAQQAAHARLDELGRSTEAAWREFDRARDSVATLGPPEIPRKELAAAWATLVGWAQQQLPAHRQAALDAEDEARTADIQREQILSDQRERCEGLRIDASRGVPRDLARDALQQVRMQADYLQDQIDTAAELRREFTGHEERAAVARSLGDHLKTNRFENWYLGRAFRRLVWRASDLLEELSNNQYALDLTENNDFLVIDHTNADERRPIRTLSGGETFLASLALALALADNLAEMATHGAARLEAIFLDEGFGTLDPDTLDTVAGALEELGAAGRMVGVVTHVRDLAERLPVRFEVRKEGRSSKVEKVLL